jgi:HME family heavy-metal exporter
VVVLVFLPLFALSGIEGRLFAPLAGAYVVALLASMVISLSVTPVLAALLLGGRGLRRARLPLRPPPVLRGLQTAAGWLIGLALRRRRWVLAGSGLLVAGAALGALQLGSQFLPAFDEGTVLVMVRAAPGTSLAESERLAAAAEQRLAGLDGVRSIHRYTGRGRHDEHAPPVTISHLMLNLDPAAGIGREQMLRRVRHRLRELAGVVVTVGQPLAHRIDHLLTGVQAEIAVKLAGPELDRLRAAVRRAAERMRRVAGVVDVAVEPQVLVPQVHVRLRHERLAELGLRPGAMAERLEIALGGKVVGRILQGERVRDLFLRLQPAHRDSVDKLRRLPIRLPAGGWTRLGDVAAVGTGYGPNAIRRDGLQRRIAVACNAQGRPVGAVVADIRRALAPLRAGLPAGYALRVEGQFAAQGRATRLVAWLSLLSLAGMILILVGQFRSLNLALQVLTCVPVAFVGGVAALAVAGLPFSVAALVGFVSLAGIATRNGILLIAHALNLMRRGARPLEAELLVRAGRERAAPVVMTALTTGMGLLPLVLAAGEAGREILHPVAVVVVGGLLTSTLFEFLLRPALLWTLGRRAAERVVFADQSCPE